MIKSGNAEPRLYKSREPEDNDFTKWLALRLANEGYRVWCDLTRLLGGEDFWGDIERAIREETAKFIFVTSRSSNHKKGVLEELGLARTAFPEEPRFIIPVRADDLPFKDFNISINRLNAIDFSHNWATGLRQLLTLLKEENVEKDLAYSPTAVSSLIDRKYSEQNILTQETEDYWSNWFRILSMPERIYFFRAPEGTERANNLQMNYPTVRKGEFLLSFSKASVGGLSDFSSQMPLERFLNGIFDPIYLARRDAQNVQSALTRQAWERLLERNSQFFVDWLILRDDRTAYLWTKGFIARLRTYPGREVPWPLLVDVCRGEANLSTVLRDLLALTKVNYNGCMHSDGMPVTLRFADAIGEILTAAPIVDVPPLAFRHYI